MNRHDTSKSGLFLIELILSIFFFIIAMAVCLQLFVKAHTLSQDTISYYGHRTLQNFSLEIMVTSLL